MFHAGIDENGLGPRLGPLVVTAALAKLSSQAERVAERNPADLLHSRLDDSKRLVDHHDVTLGEAWARACCECMGSAGRSPGEVLTALSLADSRALRDLCPIDVREQCWSECGEVFEASQEQLDTARSDLAELACRGVDVVWVRSALVCVRNLNDARRSGTGRFALDLRAMEELMLAARAHARGPLVVVCGKVGAIREYPPVFSALAGRPCTIMKQDKERSSYRIEELGEVHFVRDADGTYPLVALASLVGKYVRELLMRRIVRYYRRELPDLDDASGYNDPVTDRFVRATQKMREERGIPDVCFRREQATDAPRER